MAGLEDVQFLFSFVVCRVSRWVRVGVWVWSCFVCMVPVLTRVIGYAMRHT